MFWILEVTSHATQEREEQGRPYSAPFLGKNTNSPGSSVVLLTFPPGRLFHHLLKALPITPLPSCSQDQPPCPLPGFSRKAELIDSYRDLKTNVPRCICCQLLIPLLLWARHSMGSRLSWKMDRPGSVRSKGSHTSRDHKRSTLCARLWNRKSQLKLLLLRGEEVVVFELSLKGEVRSRCGAIKKKGRYKKLRFSFLKDICYSKQNSDSLTN